MVGFVRHPQRHQIFCIETYLRHWTSLLLLKVDRNAAKALSSVIIKLNLWCRCDILGRLNMGHLNMLH